MKNKFLVKVCAIVLLLCMYSPLYLQAATQLEVNGVNVNLTSSEAEVGAGWRYDDGELKLSNYDGSAITATGDLTIVIDGQNTITGSGSGNGITVTNGNLIIKGNSTNFKADKLTISDFTNGIYVTNSKTESYTSVKVNYVSLTISDVVKGIWAENEAEGANNLKYNTVDFTNSDIVIRTASDNGTGNNYPIFIKGVASIVGDIMGTKKEPEHSTSAGYSILMLVDNTLDNEERKVRNVDIASAYMVTYNLTNMSLTSGSPANGAHLYYESSKGSQATQDFECGFDVIPSDYALPTQGIIVKIGGNELSPDLYSYNSTNGLVTISRSHITGDIEITAAAEPCDPNTQTGTLEEIVKLGLCLGLVGMVVLAKRLRLV